MTTDTVSGNGSWIGAVLRAPRNVVVRLFDRLLDGTGKGEARATSGYAGNAEWAIAQSDARGARVLLWTSLLVVGLLLLWAGFGPIDEVVRGEGKVVPSRQVQVHSADDRRAVARLPQRADRQR